MKTFLIGLLSLNIVSSTVFAGGEDNISRLLQSWLEVNVKEDAKPDRDTEMRLKQLTLALEGNRIYLNNLAVYFDQRLDEEKAYVLSKIEMHFALVDGVWPKTLNSQELFHNRMREKVILETYFGVIGEDYTVVVNRISHKLNELDELALKIIHYIQSRDSKRGIP